MFTEISLNSWEDLKREIENIKNEFGDNAEKLLFRGQADSAWKLSTTMERKLKLPVSVIQYYELAYSAKFKLETFLNTEWKILTPYEFQVWMINRDKLVYWGLPGYDYLAFLRHHGFPSPLLDWTSSFYIALFFAFNYCDYSKTDTVSIFCYLEHAGVGKIHSSDMPAIFIFGPYERIHKRHILQQSSYTICTELDNNSEPIFSNHEKVLDYNDPNQDRLWKFILPSSERRKVLKTLNEMNINAFSLFGSEDSLVETIATNEIIRKGLSD